MSASTPESRLLRRVVPLYAATGLCATSRGALFLLVPLNALELGGIFSGFAVPGMLAVGSALVNVPAAAAVSRFGDRAVMIGGLVMGFVGAVTLALTSSLLLMAAAAFVYGIGMGVWGLARLVHLAESVPASRRGRAIAPVGGMFRVGMFLGPGLGGLMAEALGREATLLSAAALVFASAAIVVVHVPEGAVVGSRRSASPLSVVVDVVRDHGGTLATAGAAMWALSLLRAARVLLLPLCGAVLGVDTASIGFAKSASAFADMLLFYPAGQIMDRLGRKWTALPCLLTLSVGVLAIGWADGYVAFLVGGIVAGIGNGFGSGINMTLAGDFAPEDARADFIGVWRLLSDAGAAISPFVMGAVAHSLALGAASVVPFGAGLVGAFILATRMPEPLRSPMSRKR